MSPNFYLKSKGFQVCFALSKMAQLLFGLPILAVEGVLGVLKNGKGLFRGLLDLQSKQGPTVPASYAHAISKYVMEYEYVYLNLP